MLPFPEEAEYIWHWFCELRSINGDDFSAQAVDSWFRLNDIKPKPWEVQAIMAIWRALLKSRQQ